MDLKYQKYDFTPVLGWSISRFEMFDKCKRQYFYNYYSRFVPDVPQYKMTWYKELTSVALEIGNVVHDVLEKFLKRLQVSITDIDEERFFQYARSLTEQYFSGKTFIEKYYGYCETIDMARVHEKIATCLNNFIKSPSYSWIYMIAVRSVKNWMIEPEGYGETRLQGLKAYCKMDFLLPVDNDIYILDWKTGARDESKHGRQLIGYAAAANSNFGIPWDHIFPRIIYLYPEYSELEIKYDQNSFDEFFSVIKSQTEQMYAFCKDVEKNIPLPLENFEMTVSPTTCRNCNFQGLCFPERAGTRKKEEIAFPCPGQ
ncbi:MAG: PD-(D/E)XK nuclease family protein [Fibrobacter sp.]|nr:PD-(D/E)XK nuclease family protein [Fibrobacter sp.]HON11486.1 PD-(D/E)XK nuclease family protein [Chitinispirillaceae bacterium]